MLEFRILGPLEIVGDTGPVRLGGPKQRATLAILLLNANRVVSVDRLADDLYAGAPPVTAVTQVQRQVSELRKALGDASVIETRAPGYAIRIPPDGLDLHRFERLTEEAGRASASGQQELASELLTEALGLWRGGPLADLVYESFARTSIARLEEIRLAALEERIEAGLALDRHRELVGELEALVWDHPLRERLRAQLMLALYRSGRQAEALDVYRRTRERLVAEFGIEPGRALQELERAVLRHDPSLETDAEAAPAAPHIDIESKRVVLVVPSDARSLDGLLAVAERLARLPARELIIAHLLTDETQLEEAAASLMALRASLGAAAQSTAFTSREPARDVVRLSTTYDAELVLVDSSSALDGDRLPDVLASILEHSLADVGVLSRAPVGLEHDAGVFVPFGGGEHDWAALELGAWLASGANIPLRLLGTAEDPRRGRRDASRLLADASIAVQRVVGVDAAPLLAEPSDEALVAAVEPAGLVVVGISPRWRQEGIGAARRALLREARPATLLVHRGLRPSGLAPEGSRTRFSWSIET